MISSPARNGFTLIELSIVLVIIGLIVGGVLVGRDLINAASIRSTVSQVEKFYQAVNTFYGKYGYLPGDIPNGPAVQFGMVARGTSPAWGDGNGVIQGSASFGNYAADGIPSAGETAVFWTDLITMRLLQGNSDADFGGHFYPSTTNPAMRFPAANIGNSNYFYVYTGGPGDTSTTSHYGLSAITAMAISNWTYNSNPGLSVSQAAAIDTKIDDGFPQSGKVLAMYFTNAINAAIPTWAATGGEGANNSHLATNTATAGSSTTCYDNNSTAGPQQYSVKQNNGQGINCALSFGFQ